MAKKVLVADDSLTIQKVIELTFSEENYQVIAYSNGRDALNHLKDDRPDILLADAVMPELDGYALCAEAKALHPDLPVILLSGTFEHFDRDKAEAAHYNDVVMKPFDSQALIRKVESLIRHVPPAPAAPPPTEISVPPPATAVQPFAPSLFEEPPTQGLGFFAPPPDLFVRDLPGASQPAHQELPTAESLLEETVPPFDEVPMMGTGYTPPTGAVPPVEFDLFAMPTPFPEPPKKSVPPMPEPQAPPLPLMNIPAAAPAPEIPAPAFSTPSPVPPPAHSASEMGPIVAPVVVELSSTQMTAVVKAVVGQISDGVVRQIAWEVVPELAELMIRQRIKDIEEKEG